MAKSKQLEKELQRIQAKLASSAGGELASQAIDIDGIKVLAVKLDGVEPKAMVELLDQLKNKLGSAAIVLAAVSKGKVNLIAGVSKDQIARLKAGDLVNSVATQVGGKGGGRPDMARAGGADPKNLDAALKQVPDWVREHIGAK